MISVLDYEYRNLIEAKTQLEAVKRYVEQDRCHDIETICSILNVESPIDRRLREERESEKEKSDGNGM